MADDERREGMEENEEERRRQEEEKRRVEEQIEEILRQKGEQPGRARRPRPRRLSLPSIPPGLTNVLRYLLLVAAAAVLLFLSLRVLGPAGLRLAITAGLIFLFFYTVRGLLMEILRRRRSR